MRTFTGPSLDLDASAYIHECVSILTVDIDIDLNAQALNLQVVLDGRQIQFVGAFLYAIWRCRCTLTRGYSFGGIDDMTQHMRRLIEDPWIRGSPIELTKAERRSLNSEIPLMHLGTMIYNADGAARREDAGFRSSFGAVVVCNGNTVGRYGKFLGDMTNNEAEYLGALTALRHILSHPYPRVRMRLDSMLVVRQLNGIWACRASHLRDFYVEGLQLMTRIRQNDVLQTFCANMCFASSTQSLMALRTKR